MAKTATISVLFCDLVSSTERLTRGGDEAGDVFRRRFFATLRGSVAQHGGRVVKTLGDGVMATFERSAAAALACAARMHASVLELDPDDPPLLRIGVSAGEVSHEDDDWFGTPVVEASRLCAAAAPGQTLATEVVESLVRARASHHRFVALDPMELKGLGAPVAVVSVESAEADGVEPDDAPAATTTSPWRRVALGAAIGVAIIAAASAVWISRSGSDDRTAPSNGTLAGHLTHPVGYRPVLRTTACDASVSAQTPGARCEQLTVPEVRTKPGGRRIHVDVVIAPALGPRTAPPVLLLDVNEALATSPLRSVTDVYAVTLRGFSPTDEPRLVCPGLDQAWLASLARPPDDPTAVQERVGAAAACASDLRHHGVQLEGYTMAEVAADLRDLTIAAHLDHVSVSASAFSTPAAVEFARANPAVVTSLLLTNPTPPRESMLANPTLSLSKAFEQIATRCAAQPACGTRFPDLEQQFSQRFADYEAHPRLVTAMALGPDQPGVPVLLDGRRMGSALAAALSSSEQLSIIPSALAPDGVDPQLLAAAAINEDLHYYAGHDAVAGAALSYFCSYDAQTNRTAEISDAALRQFAGANDPTFQPMCAAWNVPSVFDQLAQPLAGDLPVLLVEGGISTAGVNRWSEEMAGPLEHATVLRFDTLSEDVSYVQPPCLRNVRKRFLLHPSGDLSKAVAACSAASPPIEFVGT